MRKLLAIVLSLGMVLSLTACGDKEESKDNSKAEATTQAQEEAIEDDGTIGASVAIDFVDVVKEGKATSAEDIAVAICDKSTLDIGLATMPVEEGLLNGFNNAEIKGFKEGTMFAPMIGSIPFVGYVFNLNDDTDVNEFITMLKDNADLRWNICTEADQMITHNIDKTVLFVMCPAQMEE